MNNNVFSGTIRLKDEFSRTARGAGRALRALTFPLRIAVRGFMGLGRAITYGSSVLRVFRVMVDRVLYPIRKLQAALARLGGAFRRLWFYTKLAASAGLFVFSTAATAATYTGIKFNAALEANTMAFKQFLGSGKAATAMMDKLVKLSKVGPFQLSDLTEGAQRFLAFGMKPQGILRTLRIMQDAISAMGGSGEHIDRVTIAFGQMLATGRIMGEELRQLMEAGIPAQKILRKELGLSAEQVRRIGEEGIDAEKGIAALLRGMDKLYGGMAAVQAKTGLGQWSTLKDNFRQMMGAVTNELYRTLSTKILPGLNRMTEALTDIFTGKGAFSAKISQAWSYLSESFESWWTGGGKEDFARITRDMGRALAVGINAIFGVGGGGGGQGMFWQLGKTAITSFFGGMLSELKVGGILSSKLGLALQGILLVKWGPRLALKLGKILLAGFLLKKAAGAFGGIRGATSGGAGALAGRAAGLLGATPLTAMWVKIANPLAVAAGGIPGVGDRFGGARGMARAARRRAASSAALAAADALDPVVMMRGGKGPGVGIPIPVKTGGLFGKGFSRVVLPALMTGAKLFGRVLLAAIPVVGIALGAAAGITLLAKLQGPLSKLLGGGPKSEEEKRRDRNRAIRGFRQGGGLPGDITGARAGQLRAQNLVATDILGRTLDTGNRRGPQGVNKLIDVIMSQTPKPFQPFQEDVLIRALAKREAAGKQKFGTTQKVLEQRYGKADEIPIYLRRYLEIIDRARRPKLRIARNRQADFLPPPGFLAGPFGQGRPSILRGDRLTPEGIKAQRQRIRQRRLLPEDPSVVGGRRSFRGASRTEVVRQENAEIRELMGRNVKMMGASGKSALAQYRAGFKSEEETTLNTLREFNRKAADIMNVKPLPWGRPGGAPNPASAGPFTADRRGRPRKPHGGGTFRAPSRGGEGLAILRDGERVLPTSASRPPAPSLNITVTGNTFAIRESMDVDRVASKLARKIMDQLPNVSLAVERE